MLACSWALFIARPPAVHALRSGVRVLRDKTPAVICAAADPGTPDMRTAVVRQEWTGGDSGSSGGL